MSENLCPKYSNFFLVLFTDVLDVKTYLFMTFSSSTLIVKVEQPGVLCGREVVFTLIFFTLLQSFSPHKCFPLVFKSPILPVSTQTHYVHVLIISRANFCDIEQMQL